MRYSTGPPTSPQGNPRLETLDATPSMGDHEDGRFYPYLRYDLTCYCYPGALWCVFIDFVATFRRPLWLLLLLLRRFFLRTLALLFLLSNGIQSSQPSTPALCHCPLVFGLSTRFEPTSGGNNGVPRTSRSFLVMGKQKGKQETKDELCCFACLLYTSPSPRD